MRSTLLIIIIGVVLIISIINHLANAGGPIIPQLSSVFKASVTISSMGNSRKGIFYYDLPNNRFRLDTTGFGGTLVSVAHFDEMIQHDINVPNGPCNIKKLDQDLYQLTIPPTAIFVQNVVLNGRKCSRWRATIPPYDMDYWVTSTMKNEVEIFELVRFKSQYPAMVGFVENQIDFSEFSGNYDMIETFKISTDWACPLKRNGFHYVNGYTRNALTGDILTNVQLHMTLNQKNYVTKSGKDGIFRFDFIPTGSKIEIGTRWLCSNV